MSQLLPAGKVTELVALLEDIEEIKELKARYFRVLDARDWRAFRALFVDECTFESGGSRPIHGPDSFVRRVQELIHPGTSVHHGHMPEITITGADTAQGVWSMLDYVEVDPDERGRRGVVGLGHYYDEFVRTGEGWRISSWALRRTRVVRIADGGQLLLSATSAHTAPGVPTRQE